MHTTQIAHALQFLLLLALVGCGGSSGGVGPSAGGLAVAPTSGFAVGGTTVRVQGANLSGSTQTMFGGIAGGGVLQLDADSIQVTTPANPAGAVDVVVSGAGTLTDGFTYVQYPPVAAAANPQMDAGGVAPALVSPPQVCCSGTARYVVWAEERATATGNRDVFFQRSSDRGATWSPIDVQINTSAQGTADSFDPQICCDGNNVYVAWSDTRNGTVEPYFNRSTDGGQTWLATDVRLAPGLAGLSMAVGSLSLCCQGNEVHLAWADERSQPFVAWDVFATRSLDAGTTFLPAQIRVNTNLPGALPNPAPRPRICCEGTNVYLVWDDRRTGAANSEIRFSRSTDRGATWAASDVRLDRNFTNRNAYLPKICCNGSNVYVAWLDDRSAPLPAVGADVYARVSGDGGASFGTTDTRVSTYMPASVIPIGTGVNVCCDGSNFYLTWSDARNGSTDVWFNRSINAGVAYQSGDTKLDVTTGPGIVGNGQPTIGCDAGGTVVVAWEDVRNGRNDVFTNTSPDGGATWAALETRMDRDVPLPAVSFVGVRQGVCVEGAFFTVVWTDDRNNPFVGYDVFTNSNIVR